MLKKIVVSTQNLFRSAPRNALKRLPPKVVESWIEETGDRDLYTAIYK